jgi:hypothetical protein
MSSEYEGMVVDWSYSCCGRCSDVGEKGGGGGLGADAVKIEVVGRRLAVLVDRWTRSKSITHKGFSGISIPSQTESIHIVQAVSKGDFGLCRLLTWDVRDEKWKEVS